MAKSIKHKANYCLLTTACCTIVCRIKTRSSRLCFARKPACIGALRAIDSDKSDNRLSIKAINTFIKGPMMANARKLLHSSIEPFPLYKGRKRRVFQALGGQGARATLVKNFAKISKVSLASHLTTCVGTRLAPLEAPLRNLCSRTHYSSSAVKATIALRAIASQVSGEADSS